jgi:ferredoxin-NADP reductase
MIRHRLATGSTVPMRLLYSSRSLDEVIYRDALLGASDTDGVDVELTLTRAWPDDWKGHRGRIDRGLLDGVAWRPDEEPLIYVCGPTALVEDVAETLVGVGHDPARIRTERFGPTGN